LNASPPDKQSDRPKRFFRDNIEAITMAIVMAVMLKYFVVEAYKIPTGSMQPTLMGNEDTAIFDRILVDKLSFHFRAPERFEIVVFRYPLDRSKNFIKRLVGMPGEQFRIADGDLFTRHDGGEEWKVLRRPKPVQEVHWRSLDRFDPRFDSWKVQAGTRGWLLQGREQVLARGGGKVTLPNDGGSVVDRYADGYPGNMGPKLSRGRMIPGSHPVGDLRLRGEVTALANCRSVALEFREGERLYRMEVPGPKAAPEAVARIVASGIGKDREVTLAGCRLAADQRVEFRAQNMDDLLEFEVGGQLLSLEIPSASDQRSSVSLAVEGDADFRELDLARDIYYTADGRRTEFTIPADQYVMLGDNTQDSSDSREWALVQYSWPASDDNPGSGGQFVRGNFRPPNENPIRVTGDPAGTRVFLRDEWGELHHFLEREATRGETLPAPFVPRELIVGRAVLVFWPLWTGDTGVVRLKWAR
jgi:signal peptidase I